MGQRESYGDREKRESSPRKLLLFCEFKAVQNS